MHCNKIFCRRYSSIFLFTAVGLSCVGRIILPWKGHSDWTGCLVAVRGCELWHYYLLIVKLIYWNFPLRHLLYFFLKHRKKFFANKIIDRVLTECNCFFLSLPFSYTFLVSFFHSSKMYSSFILLGTTTLFFLFPIAIVFLICFLQS